jgi:hypothetical protein
LVLLWDWKVCCEAERLIWEIPWEISDNHTLCPNLWAVPQDMIYVYNYYVSKINKEELL